MIQQLYHHWRQYSPLGSEELQWLEEHAQPVTVRRGTLLFSPEEQRSSVFVVCQGLLATMTWDEQGKRSIARFLPPYHAALTHYNFYSSQTVPHSIFALRKSSFISLQISALKQYKEEHPAASNLVHILMARSGKQYQIKTNLLLISNEVERYMAFYQHEYMKPFRLITSHTEQADYLGISRMSIHRALKRL